MRIVITDIPREPGQPDKMVFDNVDAFVLGTNTRGTDTAAVTCFGSTSTVAHVAAAVFGNVLRIIAKDADRLELVYEALESVYYCDGESPLPVR